MPTTITIMPAKGCEVRDPDRHDLVPKEGRVVPYNNFWIRRLRDGDVVEVKPPPNPTASKTK